MLKRERFQRFTLIYLLLDRGADREHTIEWLQQESAKWKRQTAEIATAMRQRGGELNSFVPGNKEEAARHEMIGILRTYGMCRDLAIFTTGPQPSRKFDYVSAVLTSVGLNVMGFKELPKSQCVAGDLGEPYVTAFTMASGWTMDKVAMTPFRDAEGDTGFVVKHLH